MAKIKGIKVHIEVDDLKWVLEHQDSYKPQWKIMQLNPTPLSISSNNAFRLGLFQNTVDEIDISGSIWTNKEGYSVKSHKVNWMYLLKYRLFLIQLDKILMGNKPILKLEVA